MNNSTSPRYSKKTQNSAIIWGRIVGRIVVWYLTWLRVQYLYFGRLWWSLVELNQLLTIYQGVHITYFTLLKTQEKDFHPWHVRGSHAFQVGLTEEVQRWGNPRQGKSWQKNTCINVAELESRFGLKDWLALNCSQNTSLLQRSPSSLNIPWKWNDRMRVKNCLYFGVEYSDF